MSDVTNVMVSLGTMDALNAPRLQQLCGWFEEHGGLSSITHGHADPKPYSWGGTKHPECNLWAGAYNHLDLNAMLRHIESVSWEWPEFLQVFVMAQEEDTFSVFMFKDGRLAPVLPYVPWPDRGAR